MRRGRAERIGGVRRLSWPGEGEVEKIRAPTKVLRVVNAEKQSTIACRNEECSNRRMLATLAINAVEVEDVADVVQIHPKTNYYSNFLILPPPILSALGMAAVSLSRLLPTGDSGSPSPTLLLPPSAASSTWGLACPKFVS